MKYDIKKPDYMQKAGNRGFHIVIELLISIAVFMTASFLSSPIISIATMAAMFTDERYIAMRESGAFDFELLIEISASMPDWVWVVQLFSQIILIIVCIVYCKFIEKRSLESMGFVKKGAGIQYLLGAAAGVIMFGAAWGVCTLTGCYESISVNSNINILMLVAYFFGFIVQGMAEEVFCRGYLMTSISRRYSVITSVMVSALVFTLLHGLNFGISLLALVNLFLYGIVMSLLMVRFNNIWLVGALHSMWNFVQGNIFGVQVSGTTSSTSVLATTAKEELAFVNGGSFGLEGGIVCTVLLAGIVLWLVISIKRRGGFVVNAQKATD